MHSVSHLYTYTRTSPLRPLAAPQPHGLTVLLKFGDELVALLDDILVLLVLVVGPVRLDDALARDTVDGAGDPAGSDELGQVAFCIVVTALARFIQSPVYGLKGVEPDRVRRNWGKGRDIPV